MLQPTIQTKTNAGNSKATANLFRLRFCFMSLKNGTLNTQFSQCKRKKLCLPKIRILSQPLRDGLFLYEHRHLSEDEAKA